MKNNLIVLQKREKKMKIEMRIQKKEKKKSSKTINEIPL
jgi:hypothetical protein